MSVASILADKGRDIVTATGDETVADICRVLTEHRIGAILITGSDGRIDGILSERDIVKACAAHGPDALKSKAAELMTRDVITVTPDDAIGTVMERMTSGRFRHMPVLKDGAVIGVISIGDVVKHRIAQAEREAEEMRSYIATA
ncbi:CBS domain-containing protein [Amorphus coralli]|uniref:CBS domain-containing protein n=1 Tax=Amorphus coralli TaxID=340680 RepID=UPI000363C97F|nr:CBS domain-containing protein [Amorphus coralli]